MTDPQTQSTRVGVVAESGPDERRVALVPKAVASLVNRGVAVVVEAGAGERALLPDELYTAAPTISKKAPIMYGSRRLSSLRCRVNACHS